MAETVAEVSPAVDGAEQPAEVAPAPGAHPPDPFAAEYQPLPPARAGVAPGQYRFLGMGGAGYYRDAHLATQGTIEAIGQPNLGVRGSLTATVPLGLTDAQVFAARVGPALHLLPYRKLDLGAYLEAGGAIVDVLRTRRTAMFALTPGVTADVALGAYWTLHVEGAVLLGTADRGGSAEFVCVPVGLFGIGPVL